LAPAARLRAAGASAQPAVTAFGRDPTGTRLARFADVRVARPENEEQLARAYESESRARCRDGARLGSLVAMFLIAAFAFLDHVRFPALFPTLLRIRLAAVAILALAYWLAVRDELAAHVRVIGAACSVAIGLMFDVLMMFTGGAGSPYYAGAGLVVLGANLLIPWGPGWSSFVAAVIVAGYVACALPAGGGEGEIRHFLNNLFYLGGTGVIAVVTSTMYERLRWREFRTRHDLIAAYRQKSEFLANMSHELRTPIHVMIGYADILLEEALAQGGDEARKLVEASRRHGLLLHRLISELLDYSKLEAGKMDMRLEEVAVGDVVEQVAESFRPVIEHKGLGLRVAVDAALPLIRSDRQRLQQVLNNLLGNAVKFTERGEIRVGATLASEWAARRDLVLLGGATDLPRAGIAVAVSDTGVGIREADLAKLAVDFQQLDAAARYGGTGLGLSFSRKLVGLLGGVIAVASRDGEGATFVVFLPAAAAAPGATPASAAA
jgi:signal transduction histidine kinase